MSVVATRQKQIIRYYYRQLHHGADLWTQNCICHDFNWIDGWTSKRPIQREIIRLIIKVKDRLSSLCLCWYQSIQISFCFCYLLSIKKDRMMFVSICVIEWKTSLQSFKFPEMLILYVLFVNGNFSTTKYSRSIARREIFLQLYRRRHSNLFILF